MVGTKERHDMIESEFCEICGRPYAMDKVEICDSCLKDLPRIKLKRIHRLIRRYYVKDLVEAIAGALSTK